MNSMFKFGDLFIKQISGTAMGVPWAPSLATIFQGLHENGLIPKYRVYTPLFLRFIDDVIGMWVPVDLDYTIDNQVWTQFKLDVNSNHGLEWLFTDRVMQLDFMDMTISIVGDKQAA